MGALSPRGELGRAPRCLPLPDFVTGARQGTAPEELQLDWFPGRLR